jgi:ABC-type nitrate/sulfonate/bicarbonate transport system permease component
MRGALALVLPALILAVWEIAGRLNALPTYLVAPSVIAATAWEMIYSGELWLHTGDTLRRALAGYFLGALCGITAGLLAGVVRPIERFYDPIISFTYPVPKIVVLPVLIGWLGTGDASKVAVITAAVFYPTFINSLYGAKAVNRLHVWSARNMGASRLQVFRKVLLPSALPQVFAGLRIALALAFIVVVASEMANSRTGLGHLIIVAEDNIRFDILYAAVLAIALLGFLGDRLLLLVRRRVFARRGEGEAAYG